jgi:hypothetical protein
MKTDQSSGVAWRTGRERGLARQLRSIACVLALAALAGCGSIKFESGKSYDPVAIQRLFDTGSARQVDVRSALGEPYGQGRAMMPFHDGPRTVWTYFFSQGMADLGSGSVDAKQSMLFVFFAGDRLDGYMWIPSDLRRKT